MERARPELVRSDPLFFALCSVSVYRHRLEHVIFVQRVERAVIVERVVKYGQVPRGEGGDKVRLALRARRA
jgi:hypothetical protein